jgi:uncharacterized cupredoxin-like copper-binding protein
MRKAIVLVALVCALAVVGSAGAAATTTTVKVKAGEFFFKLSKSSIAKPGTVVFAVQNSGHLAHDFKIAGKTTALIQPGKSATLKVRFAKAGKYAYLCTVPGHASAGMKGNFTVR